jgi:DNA-binding MurR/RpiR family transcriptional regulator
MEDAVRGRKPGERPNIAEMTAMDNAVSKIRALLPTMSKTNKRIASFILEDPNRIVKMSVTELAEATDSAQSSVIKYCRQIGLSGFQQLKLSLAGETVARVQFIHEDLEQGDDVDSIVGKIFAAGGQALSDTRSVLDIDSVKKATEIFRAAKRIEIYGIGSAAPIAEDARYRMLRIGLDVRMEIDSHVQAISASLTNPEIATLTISHSGASIETLTATRLAKEAGAKTVVITNYGRSPIQAYADVILYTMAKETLFRTEAMTSRIAQLCVVDALIATLAMADYARSTDTLKRTFDTLSAKRL